MSHGNTRPLTTVLTLTLLGCRAPPEASPAPAPDSSSPGPAIERHVGVHASALVVHGDQVLALGRQRTAAIDEGAAWVGGFDIDGRMLWSATRDHSRGQAEAARALADDVYVFGRGVDHQAWLWRLDTGGRTRGFATIETGQVVAFTLDPSATNLVSSRGAAPPSAVGSVSLTWLRWAHTETQPRIVRTTLEAEARSLDELDCEAIDALHLRCADSTWALAEDPGPGEHELDYVYDDEVPDLARAGSLAAPASLALTPAVPAAFDLGSTALLAIQRRPSRARETWLELVRVDASERDERLGQLAADDGRAPGSLADPSGPWPWLEPLVDPAALSVADQIELGAWLLDDVDDCGAITLDASCEVERVTYPVPDYRDVDDPCWKLGALVDLAELSAGPALAANLDAWLSAITATDFRPRGVHDARQDIDWSPRAAIVDALAASVPAATLIPAQVLDVDSSYQIPLDAIAELDALPPAEAEAIARALLDGLRSDPTRCEEVTAVVELLDELDAERPRWQAELDDPCDILFVMCTELQAELPELVVDPAGFTVTETCASDRPSDPETADDWGLEVCQPTQERTSELVFGERDGISAQVAASCGSDEALTELGDGCGDASELAVHTYRWRTNADGRVWFEGLDIRHTTVE